jgi:YVTN family beta-propeller protein
VAVGNFPFEIAANPTTNKIYVKTQYGSTVTVIDGATDTITDTVAVAGGTLDGIAVNKSTNKIYVVDSSDSTVEVIDGATNTITATVAVGSNPSWNIAVNPTTNKIYVSNGYDVTVINGATNTTTAIMAGTSPEAIAVNEYTGNIYVTNYLGQYVSNTVTVIDGATNTITATVAVGIGAVAIAVNRTTNKIYVVNAEDFTVTVIDGATNTVTDTLAAAGGQNGIAANPTTNRIYVSNGDFPAVITVIDGGPAIASAKLGNLSTRAQVQTGANRMIGGFIISGTGPKTVLLRARGPSMGTAPFNLTGVLANPTVKLYSGSTVIAQNDNWQTTDALCGSPAVSCGGVTEITATGKDPCQPNPGQTGPPANCSKESAIYVTLPPGSYSAIMSGVSSGTGLGLVEVFEVNSADVSALVNLSTRAKVQTGANRMIGGFIVSGTAPKTVLLRARGPSLGTAPFNLTGVLANPTVKLYSGSTVIAQSDDWQTTDTLCGSPAVSCGGVTEIIGTGKDPCQPNPGQTGPPANCSKESAIYITLPPGSYSAIVSGVGATSGLGMVEVFDVN